MWYFMVVRLGKFVVVELFGLVVILGYFGVLFFDSR